MSEFAAGDVDTGLIAAFARRLIVRPRTGRGIAPPGSRTRHRPARRCGLGRAVSGLRLNGSAKATGAVVRDQYWRRYEVSLDGPQCWDGGPQGSDRWYSNMVSGSTLGCFAVKPDIGGGLHDGAILSPMPGRIIAVEVRRAKR